MIARPWSDVFAELAVAAVAFVLLVLAWFSAEGIAALGRRLRRRGADDAYDTLPVTFAKPPAPGTPRHPVGAAPSYPPAAAPAPGHGGLIKSIDVFACGRAVITDHRNPDLDPEVIPGDCAACTTGACTFCGVHPVWTPAGTVRRYEKCPAHAEPERQP
jgi:hypothetical protein